MPTSVKAGDPITLQIGITGDGPMNLVQAPPLVVLPQLTADFKVTSEPLAGIVEGDAKLFTASIRPRHAGITQIPAIPLSFFDPSTEKFVTVKSEPIAITVAEADRLALGSIVGAANAVGSSSRKVRPNNPTDRSQQLHRCRDHRFRIRTPFLGIVFGAVIPTAVRGVVMGLPATTAFGRFAARNSPATTSQRPAGRRQAQSPLAVASAVKDYVAGILRRPSSSLTRSEITAGLLSSGCQGSVQQLDDVLAQL